MEDWLYAAGWDKGPLRKCAGEPEPAGTAIASDAAENRAVVFLVETSDRKKPLESTLGGTEKVIHSQTPTLSAHCSLFYSCFFTSADTRCAIEAERTCPAQRETESDGHRPRAAVRVPRARGRAVCIQTSECCAEACAAGTARSPSACHFSETPSGVGTRHP
jgi:hypothetical protein